LVLIMRYGLLDDAGQVVRWLDYPPKHGDYITQQVAAKPRATPYQLALARCGYAPF
jgi:hypothetical protein